MIQMLVIYMLLGGIGLSLWHSYRLIRISKQPGATVNAILDGRREKGLLIFGGAVAGFYVLTILFLMIFWKDLATWIVLTPFLYLVAWSLPRPFLKPN
ncbi:hypothetical protein G0Q06_06185 [Puniceicoccales bacterium CK1056]|uniref:Uncharacterized protein n=1 Tax=Oceanipulchritudo coccoides TaxID=2706888 RepID=A0A6B2M171_9BACT|nr:hypothetical protein [Oceanipulchritudo coccoides]NDV62029.1 hypothetical protein [Oceanipulchritudo coccoides]